VTTCPLFTPNPTTPKACLHYLKGTDAGFCRLPDHFICVEWIARFGSPELKALIPILCPSRDVDHLAKVVTALEQLARILKTLPNPPPVPDEDPLS
jgi:hypothetical protein